MFQLVRGETAGFILENDRRGVKNSYMVILLYGALLLSQLGTGAKQYAMKKCGAAALERRLITCAELDSEMKNGSASYVGLERLIAESACAR